jgi:hypothetical protein
VQQPAQLSGPQRLSPWQLPPPVGLAPQVWPAPQVVQAAPPVPQAPVALPGRHLSPTQQPAQFEAVQLVELQEPVAPSQTLPVAAQFPQVKPFLAHAVGSLPLRHRGPPWERSQQPSQLAAVQVAWSRPQTWLLVQNSNPFARQSEQFSPIDPHARWSCPFRQTPAESQQPPGQESGPQAAGVVPPASRGISSSRLERPQPGATRITRTSPEAVIPASK